MNIIQESIEQNHIGLLIEIEPIDYKENFEKSLKEYRNKANIPGFRPGQVPIGMVKKMHGEAIKGEEINKLVMKQLDDYIKDNNIDYLGEPIINNEKSYFNFETEDNNSSFYFEIGLQPEIELNKDKLPVLIDYHIIPTADEIDKEIEHYRKIFGTIENVDEVVENDVIISGAYIYSNSSEKDAVETTLYTEQIVNEEEKAKLIGKKIGDVFTIDLSKTFERKHQIATILKVKEEELENIDMIIDFTINSIKKIVSAEINEELYKKIFPTQEIENEEHLRTQISNLIIESFKPNIEKYFLNTAVETLLKELSFDIPNEFFKKWLIETNENINKENIEEEYKKYIDTLKWQLIENKIIKQYSIKIEKEEIKNYIKDYYFKYFNNQNLPDFESTLENLANKALENKEDVKNIYNILYDNKILVSMQDIFHIEKKEVQFDEFLKIMNNHSKNN